MSTDYVGRGDPARTMALLWGTAPSPQRGPRQGLTVERIVEAAVALADADGLAALSMRKVADALSVGTMSLYTYVPGKAELLEVMVDRVVGEQEMPEPGLGTWRARLEAYARGAWALYHRHGWLLQVASSRGVLGPHTVAVFDGALGLLEGTGLSGRDAVAVISLVNGYVRGAAQVAVEARESAARTGQTDDEWWAVRAPLLAQHFEAGRFPRLAAASAEGAFDQPEGGADYTVQRAIDEFEFGLARMLDGIEVAISSLVAPASQ